MYPSRFFMPSRIPNMVSPNIFYRGNTSIFSSLFRGIKSFNWKGLLNGANKTLNVVNQTIPLIREAKPMVGNVKNVIKLAKAFRNETNQTKASNIIEPIIENTVAKSDGSPTFFV